MKALVCIKDGYGYSVGQLISLVEDNYTSYLLSDGFAKPINIPSNLNKAFLKVVYKDAVPTKFKKDEVVYDTCPLVEDTSWTLVPFQPEVLEVIGQPEILAKPAIPEHWVKDGFQAVFIKPMMSDPSYEVIPGFDAGYFVEEDIVKKLSHENQKIIQDTIKKGEDDEKKCKTVLNFIGGINRTEGKTKEEIDAVQLYFKDIEAALRASRPDTARGLIEALDENNCPFPPSIINIALSMLQ